MYDPSVQTGLLREKLNKICSGSEKSLANLLLREKLNKICSGSEKSLANLLRIRGKLDSSQGHNKSGSFVVWLGTVRKFSCFQMLKKKKN